MVGPETLNLGILVRIQVWQQKGAKRLFAAQKQAWDACDLDSKTLRVFSGRKSARCTEAVSFEKRTRGPSLAGVVGNIVKISFFCYFLTVLVDFIVKTSIMGKWRTN